MSSIYNKRYTPFFTYLDNFYNNETLYIRNLQKHKIEDDKIPYDAEDLESEIEILNSRYNNEI